MFNSVKINKNFAISKLQGAIDRAEEALKKTDFEQEYYEFHSKTIEINKAEIEKIKNAPYTEWN